MARSPLSRGGVTCAALALPYLPFLFGVDLSTAPPSAATVAAALLGAATVGAPGAAGMLLGRGRGPARRVVQLIAGAAGANVVAAVLLRLMGVEATPRTFAAALALVTVLAGIVGAMRGGRLPDPRRTPAATVVFVGAFLLAAEAGLDVVPPLEDQDSEVQGTAVGLTKELAPVCLTNRSTLYYFAHPPLLHAFAASTLTLAGQLPAVRGAYDAAVAEREKIPWSERRGWAAIGTALRGHAPRHDTSLRWWRDVYGAFVDDPALLGTRAPNFVFAAVAATLIFLWLGKLGVSRVDATLVVLSYATLPEVFIRSGYGGYYALDAATWLAGARLATAAVGGARAGYFAGALGALADHKLLLFGGAAATVANVRALATKSRAPMLRVVPLILGMATATLAFWVYGLSVAPSDFVADHWFEHGVARVFAKAAPAGHAQTSYPSPGALWLEFLEHFGIWAALAGGAVVTAIARVRRRREGSDLALLLLAWTFVVSVAATLTDWRQTKHLALLVPALTILIGVRVVEAGTTARRILRVALIVAIAWNVGWLVHLAHDFEAMSATPLW